MNWQRSFRNRQQLADNSRYVIMCVGDSLTQMRPDNNYPLFLQKIIDRQYPENGIKVINQGAGGFNSTMILDEIPSWIAEVNPDMVIIMMGGFYETEKSRESSFFVKTFESLKVFNLIVPFYKKVGDKFRQIVSLSKFFKGKNPFAMESDTAEGNTKKNQKTTLPQIKMYVQASLLQSAGSREKALWYFYLLLKTPNLSNQFQMKIYGKIMDILWEKNDYAHYVRLMHKLPQYQWESQWSDVLCRNQELAPLVIKQIGLKLKRRPEEPIFYDLLSVCYQKAGKENLSAVMAKKTREIRKSSISQVTVNNYIKLISYLSKKGIQPVVMSYPVRDISVLQDSFKEHDLDFDVIFVNNGEIFQKFVETQGYEEYFIDRKLGNLGHLTKKGSRLMARNVFNSIEKNIE